MRIKPNMSCMCAKATITVDLKEIKLHCTLIGIKAVYEEHGTRLFHFIYFHNLQDGI